MGRGEPPKSGSLGSASPILSGRFKPGRELKRQRRGRRGIKRRGGEEGKKKGKKKERKEERKQSEIYRHSAFLRIWKCLKTFSRATSSSVGERSKCMNKERAETLKASAKSSRLLNFKASLNFSRLTTALQVLKGPFLSPQL